MDLVDVVARCSTGHPRFASAAEARAALLEIIRMPPGTREALAARLGKPDMVLRGLQIECGFALKADDWLRYHHRPTTRPELKRLRDEFQSARQLPISDLLGWELYWGASALLRSVAWDAPPS